MSRLICVALLLVVLMNNFYDNAVQSASLHVTKVHLRACRCRALPNGRLKCRYPLSPKTRAEEMELTKCLCSRENQSRFPEFQGVCGLWHGGPLTLL